MPCDCRQCARQSLACATCHRPAPGRCRCGRALCADHLVDPAAHAEGCPLVGTCEACAEREVGLRRCRCCGIAACARCHAAVAALPRPMREEAA